MKRNNRFKPTTTHLILLSFLCAILIGTLLLMLPISSATRVPPPFIDAFFTATTATCVTGLVTVPTATSWSFFGQVVILFLIQIGGLGIITVMSGIAIALHKRMGLSDRLLLQDAFNLNSLSGLVRLVKQVIKGTFIVEGVGAILYMTVFVPQYGLRGVWISIFNSISAFCNAGIDVIGMNSLCDYVTNPIVNFVTCALIVLGGIGFIVWWDVIRVFRERKYKKGRILRRLTLHSKLVLFTTISLILVGGVCFYVFERNNPLTLGGLDEAERIQAALFQSITTRTAGFATVGQEHLTNPSAILSLLLMFIGGSPVGTAGGVKTITFSVLMLATAAAIRNKTHTSAFGRTIPQEIVAKASGVVGMSFLITFVSTVLLSLVADAPAIDILYETVSATATVGLSRNLTSSLNLIGKWIIAVTMYLGRIGPISLAVAFSVKKENQNTINDPIEQISVG